MRILELIFMRIKYIKRLIQAISLREIDEACCRKLVRSFASLANAVSQCKYESCENKKEIRKLKNIRKLKKIRKIKKTKLRN